MTYRITKSDLQGSVDYLNKLIGNVDPETGINLGQWKVDEDGEYLRTVLGYMIPNNNVFCLDWCNGGVALCTMGGRDVLHRGTKGDLYKRLRAFIDGLQMGIDHGSKKAVTS